MKNLKIGKCREAKGNRKGEGIINRLQGRGKLPYKRFELHYECESKIKDCNKYFKIYRYFMYTYINDFRRYEVREVSKCFICFRKSCVDVRC